MNQWPLLVEQFKLLIYTAPATLLAIAAHEASCLFYAVGQPFSHQKLHDLCRISQVHPERQP